MKDGPGYTTADIKALEVAVIQLQTGLNYIPDFVKEINGFSLKLSGIDNELTSIKSEMIQFRVVLKGKASDVEVACAARHAKMSVYLIIILSIIMGVHLWRDNGRSRVGNNSSTVEKRGVSCDHGSFKGGPGDRERNILPTEI